MTMLKRELTRQREGVELYLDVSSSIGIALLDSALNIMDCNHGFIRIFHQKKPIGSPVADFFILGDNNFKHSEGLMAMTENHKPVTGLFY
jgi:PAS domain-containing protein